MKGLAIVDLKWDRLERQAKRTALVASEYGAGSKPARFIYVFSREPSAEVSKKLGELGAEIHIVEKGEFYKQYERNAWHEIRNSGRSAAPALGASGQLRMLPESLDGWKMGEKAGRPGLVPSG